MVDVNDVRETNTAWTLLLIKDSLVLWYKMIKDQSRDAHDVILLCSEWTRPSQESVIERYNAT